MNNLLKVGFFVLLLGAGCVTTSPQPNYQEQEIEPLPPIVAPAPVVMVPAPPLPLLPPPPPPLPKPADIPAFQGPFDSNLGDDLNQPLTMPASGLIDCRFTNLGERIGVILGKNFNYSPFIGQNRDGLQFRVFRPYFVFDSVKDDLGRLHYLVGPTPAKKDISVWVLAQDVCYWDSGLADRCLKLNLPVYTSREEVVRSTFVSNAEVIAEIVNLQAIYPVVEQWSGKLGDSQAELHRIVFLSESGELLTGWIVAKIGNDTQAEAMVYIALAELRMLLANLYLLIDVLQNPEAIRQIPAVNSSGLYRQVPYSLLFLADEGILGMDVWLTSRGVPVQKNSVLRLTKTRIETMSPTERVWLGRYLRESVIPQLETELQGTRWCFGTEEFKFGWIRYNALP